MAKITTMLFENLRTQSVAQGTTEQIVTQYVEPTDYPKPGDVLCSALGACMLTMAGAVAAKRGDNLSGARVEVEPVFDAYHTRVVEMKLAFSFPDGLSAEQKKFYAKTALTCPVHNSLREDIKFTVRMV